MQNADNNIYNDLLIIAARVASKLKTAKFSAGDEVRVRQGAGTFDGEVIEEQIDGVIVNNPKIDKARKYPFGAVTLLSEIAARAQERKRQDDEEARLRAEEDRLRAEEEAKLGRETAHVRALERAKDKIETADDFYNANPAPLDAFAEWLAQQPGGLTRPVRVHYGEQGASLAEWLFQKAGVANTLQPYIPGSRGGIEEMWGVQGVVKFPTPPNFKESDVPVGPGIIIKNDGKNVEINNTAFAFQLIERGFIPHS